MASGDLFGGVSEGYSPMSSGTPFSPWSPAQGVPGGMLGAMAFQVFGGMLEQKLGTNLAGFHADQNMFDRLQAKKLSEFHAKLVSETASNERAGLERIARGAKNLWGVENPYIDKNIGPIAGAFGKYVMPFVAQMYPDYADYVSDVGSSTGFGRSMFLGSRYRTDPVTGRVGMSEESATRQAVNVFNELYGSGSTANTSGLKATRMGEAADELIRRGMMPGALPPEQSARAALSEMSPRWYKEVLDKAGFDGTRSVSSLSASEITKLTEQPEVAGAMRDMDDKNFKQQLQKYSGSITAMREIFADIGQLNVPMRELINALEQMTNGGLSQLDANKVETIVRQTHAIAKMGGIDMRSVMMMQGHAGRYAQELGLNPVFAATAAADSAAFAGALNATGALSAPMWGLSGQQALMQQDQNLRMAGAASPLGNQMGMALRLSEGGQLDPGSPAAQYVAAIQQGKTTFGQGQSANMGDAAFVDMIVKSASKMTAPQVWGMLQQNSTNQESLFNNQEAQAALRNMQGDEVAEFLAQQAAENTLMQAGITDPKVRSKAAKAAIEALQNMSPRDRASAAKRERIMGEAIGAATGITDQKTLDGLASGVYGDADNAAREQLGTSLADQLTLHDKDVIGQTENQKKQAKGEALARQALGGIGLGNFLDRTLDALGKVDMNDPKALGEVVIAAAGGVSDKLTAEQAEALGDLAVQHKEKMAEYNEAVTARDKVIRDGGSNEDIAAAEKEMADREKEIKTIKEDAERIIEETGLEEKMQEENAAQRLFGMITIRDKDGNETPGDFAGGMCDAGDPVPTAGVA